MYFTGGIQNRCAFLNLEGSAIYFYVNHVILLFFEDRAEFTVFETLAALDTLRLIYDIRRPFLVTTTYLADTINGTTPGAGAATDTFFGIDLEAEQILTLAGTAFLVPDMLQVFIPEISYRRQSRIRCGTTKHTEGGLGHGLADSL
jgi:hypothetical protein